MRIFDAKKIMMHYNLTIVSSKSYEFSWFSFLELFWVSAKQKT